MQDAESEGKTRMFNGVCVWFRPEVGYGFVKRDTDGADFFCHFSAIQMDGYKKLDQGDVVEFDVETGPKGKLQCANVQIVRKVRVA